MSKKSAKRKKQKVKPVGIYGCKTREEIIKFAAERLAELLWQTWQYKKKNSKKSITGRFLFSIDKSKP